MYTFKRKSYEGKDLQIIIKKIVSEQRKRIKRNRHHTVKYVEGCLN